MIESFLITGRETLEAALVVGIVLAYLNKTNNKQYKKTVYIAIATSIAASILAAILFNTVAGGFEGRAEELFEGITMLLGAALLTTMILWMLKQKHVAKQLEERVHKQLVKHPFATHTGIFLIVFMAILREGVETVIFLNAINFAGGVNLIGGVLGIVAAITIGVLFFYGTAKVNLKKLFSFTSVLLILFAAGLVAHGVHELEEAGVLPSIVEHVYDVNHIVNEKGVVGSFLTGLFGYNGNPSLLEVLVYWTYLVTMCVVYSIYARPAKTN
jgi:high-affinity iron transporter